MRLNEKLKELRIEKGWTQEELAKQLYVTPQTVSNYENGHRAIDYNMIEKLSKLFGYGWQKEDKLPSNKMVVNFSDVVANGMNLSAEFYINKQLVTLRVDIEQGMFKKLKKEAAEANKTMDQLTQDILKLYFTK